MTASFANIGSPECRAFLADRLSDDSLLGRNGFLLRHGTYVLHYDPKQESHAKDLIRQLVDVDLPTRGVRAVAVNLYDMVLQYLDDADLWEPLCEAEAYSSRNELIMMLQDTVNVQDVLKPRAEELVDSQECDIVFITGVGETFPYIRTHALLSELEIGKPVVLVFPGQYTQNSDGSSSLDILNLPSGASGGYYRATNVYDL